MARINSKKKGGRGERSAAKSLEGWTGWEFSRVPQSGGLRWKNRTAVAGDILCTEPNIIWPFCIEVKFHDVVDFGELMLEGRKAGIDVLKFWDQATEGATASKKIPMLMIRKNNMKSGEFLVVLPWEFYIFAKKLLKGITPKLVFNKQFVVFRSDKLYEVEYSKLHKISLAYLNL